MRLLIKIVVVNGHTVFVFIHKLCLAQPPGTLHESIAHTEKVVVVFTIGTNKLGTLVIVGVDGLAGFERHL